MVGPLSGRCIGLFGKMVPLGLLDFCSGGAPLENVEGALGYLAIGLLGGVITIFLGLSAWMTMESWVKLNFCA